MSSGEGKSVVGGATIFLFNSKKQLKTGKQKLQLWPQKEADGRVPTTTPGKVGKPFFRIINFCVCCLLLSPQGELNFSYRLVPVGS